MAFVLATPDALGTVASNVADMGSTSKSATTAAAAHTNSLAAAAADEVSAQIAAANACTTAEISARQTPSSSVANSLLFQIELLAFRFILS